MSNLIQIIRTRAEWREPRALALIPEHMRDDIVAYIDRGEPPERGEFLLALLEGDFFTAAKEADDDNIRALGNWARYLYAYAPSACYRTPEAVKEWVGHRGMEGWDQ